MPPGPLPSLPIDAVELPTRYGSFWFDGSDEKLTPWIRRHATWEADVLRLLHASVRPGMVAADVGANVGFHTVVLAHQVGPSGAVHAFEPLPETLEILRANVWRHGCANVTVHEAAATDAPGVASLALDPEGRSGAYLGAGGIDVRATTLDEALEGQRLDVLKLDVEGAEPLVLRGAAEVLAASPTLVAVVEFRAEPHLDGTSPDTVLAEYEGLGFTLERLHADGGTSRASHDELLSAAAASGTLNIVLRR